MYSFVDRIGANSDRNALSVGGRRAVADVADYAPPPSAAALIRPPTALSHEG